MKTTHFMGLDLGQRQDYTALAVARRRELETRWDPVTLVHRREPRLEFVHTERFPLGTSYVTIVREVRSLVQKLAARNEGVRMAVDATGVGVAVVDMLQSVGLRGVVWPVTVSGGSSNVRGSQGSEVFTVNKTSLFYGLRVGLEQGRTVFSSQMKNVQVLQDELCAMGTVAGQRGMRVSGAPGKQHDDLAFAAALAQWAAMRVHPGDVRRAGVERGSRGTQRIV